MTPISERIQRDLLLPCSREEVFGVCLYETLNEATHRFMLAEAMAKRLISSETRASFAADQASFEH